MFCLPIEHWDHQIHAMLYTYTKKMKQYLFCEPNEGFCMPMA
jgi:hypothetical protein